MGVTEDLADTQEHKGTTLVTLVLTFAIISACCSGFAIVLYAIFN